MDAKKLLLHAGVAGIAGGVAMIPVGLLLRRVLGYSINVYGELVVQTIFGRVSPGTLAIEHFLLSWGMALPLLALHVSKRRGVSLWLGALYGAAIWLVVNSLLLPAAFDRPTPWVLGWDAIWPSLTVHILYGAVCATVLRLVDPASAPSPLCE